MPEVFAERCRDCLLAEEGELFKRGIVLVAKCYSV